MYCYPHTTVFDHCSCRFTRKISGIGLGDRAWGGTKTTRDGERCSISGEYIGMRSILYTTWQTEVARLMKKDNIKNTDHDMFEEDGFT